MTVPVQRRIDRIYGKTRKGKTFLPGTPFGSCGPEHPLPIVVGKISGVSTEHVRYLHYTKGWRVYRPDITENSRDR